MSLSGANEPLLHDEGGSATIYVTEQDETTGEVGQGEKGLWRLLPNWISFFKPHQPQQKAQHPEMQTVQPENQRQQPENLEQQKLAEKRAQWFFTALFGVLQSANFANTILKDAGLTKTDSYPYYLAGGTISALLTALWTFHITGVCRYKC